MTCLTKRGTILGGRLDCYVRNGAALLVLGRTCPVEDRALVNLAFDRCGKEDVALPDGSTVVAVHSSDFVTALFDMADYEDGPIPRTARQWIRVFVQRGLRAHLEPRP